MNTLRKRLLSAMCMVAFGVSFAIAQTNMIKHIVDRGETLASIAKRYATTEAKIIELNPDAAQFLYVGMELTIPVVKDNDVVTEATKNMHNNLVKQNESNQSITNLEMHDTNFSKNDDTKFEKEVFVGVSMNNFTGDDIDNFDMKIGFNAGFTARYYFVKDFFIEGSLGIFTKGYKSKSDSSSGAYWDDEGPNYDGSISTKYTSYNFDLPILIGYRLAVNDDFHIKLKVGPYLTYALSGKLKEEGYWTEYEDIHSSSTEYINKETKIGDINGFKNFGYGIHADISVDYKQFILSASYQHAFSKVFNDAKAYEQNILISLGYRF